MTKLTVERLFGDLPLLGALPAQVKFSPDNKWVTYQKVAADNRERLDLWGYYIASDESRELLNADTISTNGELSEEEKAQRERARQFTTGISEHHWHPEGDCILVIADGAGFLLAPHESTCRVITPANSRQTNFEFSPKGQFISYVREGDIFIYELETERETKLTHHAHELETYGLAEFVAQEEMQRLEGYWWSPDETQIACTRVDNSPIEVTNRYDMNADGVRVVEQRYPYAGKNNATVELGIIKLEDKSFTPLDTGANSEDYLVRVDFSSETLWVQIQNRAQNKLEVKRRCANGFETALTEHHSTWINLHNNFVPTGIGVEFLWTSERSGSSQIYRVSDGDPKQLTHLEGRVNKILYANSETVLFEGWEKDPTQQHLYSLSLGDNAHTQLTEGNRWHQSIVDNQGNYHITSMSDEVTPNTLTLAKIGEQDPVTILNDDCVVDGHPYHEYLDEHSQPVLGVLQAQDGQNLHYRLTQPTNIDGHHPVVVYVYGGPGIQRITRAFPPLLLQLFAARGFGVLELDNRGGSNREKAFEDPIHRHLGKIEMVDQLKGVEFLKTLPWVDATRIGVFGHSYGGYMTLMCMSLAADVFKAGVAVAPVTLWSLYDTHYTERYLGDPQENAAGYAASDVIPHLGGITGPLLVMHGMADDNVLFTNTTKLISTLQTNNTPFEFMAYPGSKHGLQEKSVAIHRFNMILDFFTKSL